MQRLRTRLRAGATAFPPATFALNFLTGALDLGVTFSRGTTATFVGSNGLIQTAAINTPRFDYDPVTLAAKGLLIEEQRVNLQTYSEDFTNAIWSSSTLTIAANSTVSPDGLTTADTGTRTTTGVTENMRRATTAQAINTAYTLSVFVKANTAGARLYIRNLAVDNTATTGVVQFNPADGTISTTYGSTYTGKVSMTALGNGWYRCSMTGTTGATIANNLIDIGVTDGTSAVGGVAGNSVFIWGAQLEAGAFATSYIPTVASTVTRSADVATMTGTNFSSWYNQSEGTFVADASTFSSDATDKFVANINNNGFPNRILMNFTATNTFSASVVSNSVSQVSGTNGAAVALNTPVKMGFATKLDDFAFSRSGIAPTTDNLGAMPVTVDRLWIGSATTTAFLNGHIRQIAYYNTRLPNATLVSLTA